MTRRYLPPRRRWGSRHEPSPVLLVTEDERGVLVAAFMRLMWRYRSELAPFAATGALAVTAAWMHAVHRGWAVGIAAVTVALSGSLATPPDCWRVGRLLKRWHVVNVTSERLYAASVVGLAGCWLAVATVYGPDRKPLPAVALLGMVAAGVPWWAHRRRRARVRVERTIAAWPQFAEAVSLPGSRIVSAVVNTWGWTARVALRRGHTARHATDQAAAIESALGVRPGGVRVEPDPHRADHVVVRVVETDPHARPIPWTPLTAGAASVLSPVHLGVFEDGSAVAVRLAYRNVLVGGVVGSGKSGVLNVVLASLAMCRDVEIWGVDLKGGMELGPWSSCMTRLATSPEDAVALMRDAVVRLEDRAVTLAGRTERLWQPSPDQPALVIVVDEYAELPDAASEFADSISRRGRAVAVNLIAATQRPTQRAMGHGAVRSQMDVRICLRVRERRDVDLILGQGMAASGWRAESLDAAGKFLISDPEHTTARPARAFLVTDSDVRRVATEYGSEPCTTTEDSTGSTTTEASAQDGGPERALLAALDSAPDDGLAVSDLMKVTGMSRPWTYRRLAEYAAAGRAMRTRQRGHWRAVRPSDQ